MLNVNQFIDILKNTLSYHDKFIGLHEPSFAGNEWRYIKECIDTGWVSSVGKFVDKFEQDLCHFTEVKHAVATVNGTAALHIAFMLSGIKPDDEVLMPTLTFVATTNALSYCRGIPHFVDAEADTLGINPIVLDDYLKEITRQEHKVCINRLTNRPIRALCLMHTLGHPVDIDPLLEVAKKYHLNVIEDAAEALGSYYKGKHVGHKALLSTLSFNGNKIITTGGGGAILTNDEALAKRAKHLTTTAKLSHPWLFEHDEIGYNYRLPNLNAALGCAQLECLSSHLAAKRLLFTKYQTAFSGFNGLQLLREPSYAKSNYWLIALLLDDDLSTSRDQLLKGINENGMMARPLWNLQHTLPMYRNCPRMPVPVAENLVKRVITIPSSPQLCTVGKEDFINSTAMGMP